jgi:hypothetical protein
MQLKVFSSYTWANLYVRCLSWGTPNQVIRSRIGGVDGNMTVTVTGTGVFEDTVNTEALVSGNLINWTAEAATGLKTYAMFGSTLEDTSTNAILQICSQQATTITFGITRFTGISGLMTSGGGQASTEANVQYTLRRATTYTNLRVTVATNTFNAATTWSFRVNAGPGAQSVSIGNGATGAFEDTTNSDVVAAAAEVNHSIDTTASGSGSIIMGLAQLAHVSTGRETATSQPIGVSRTTDAYFGAEADSSSNATQANSQIPARAAFTANNLFVNVPTHGTTSGVDIFLQQNNSNSALTVNVPASTTGLFEDTTNSVNILVADTYNYFLDHGGGAGGITVTIIGFANGPGSLAIATLYNYLTNLFRRPKVANPNISDIPAQMAIAAIGAAHPTQPTLPTIPTEIRRV